MSKVTLTQKVDALAAVVSQLATIVAAQQTAAPAPVAVATVDKDKEFADKFAWQSKKAKALAAKSGNPANIYAVPKGKVMQCWYMSSSRKAPAGSTLMLTINPDGSTKTHINLGNLKVA